VRLSAPPPPSNQSAPLKATPGSRARDQDVAPPVLFETAPNASPLVVEELLPVPSNVETDPETMATVHTVSSSHPPGSVDGAGGVNSAVSEGSTVLVKFSDGSTLARFRDGTSIRTAPSREHVLVENASAFPAIWRDCTVDATASKHARGEKVPVATGGERIRMRLALPDGTKVTCTYNTRVTSEVRGKIVVLRPDFTEIIATDSPLVEPTKIVFKPRGVWRGGEFAGGNKLAVGDPVEAAAAAKQLSKQDARPENDNGDDSEGGGGKQRGAAASSADDRGVYQFNLFHGRLVMEDLEHNVFYASVNPDKVEKNEKGATYDVDLAGKIEGEVEGDAGKAEAVVNDPMPPRLFVMSRDGSALELLRPTDMKDFARRAELGAVTVKTSSAEKVMGDPLDAPGKQRVHHQVIERPRVSVFAHAFPSSLLTPWHGTALPVCARAGSMDQPRAPPHVIAPRIVIRRVWYEVTPLDDTARSRLQTDLKKCRSFRSNREKSFNRFAVEDDRSPAELEAERHIQNKLQKAIKAAKAKRKALLNKSLESEKRAAAAAAAAAESDDEADESEEDNESGDEAIESQRQANNAAFYSEVEAAYVQRTEESGAEWMTPESLKEALVQVCSRAFDDLECAAFIRSLPHNTWAESATRVSLDDFLAIARLVMESGAKKGNHGDTVDDGGNTPILQLGQLDKGDTTIQAKELNFWDTATGQEVRTEVDSASGAAGGGLAAARAKQVGKKALASGDDGPSASPPRRSSKPPKMASVGDEAAPTFTFDLDSTPGLTIEDASCWALNMGSLVDGSEAEATLWLRNTSPFAARFRCVKRGTKGLARLSAAKQGPVASGAIVPLRVLLRCDGGDGEDTVTVVSEHQELRIIVHAQVFRTKALQR